MTPDHADVTKASAASAPRSGFVTVGIGVPLGEVTFERLTDLQKPDRPER